MKLATTLFLTMIGLMIFASVTVADEENLIEQQIASVETRSPWRFGPMLFIPNLALMAGYDSNGLAAPTTGQESSNFLGTLGVSVNVPIKKRALIGLDENLDYRYYSKIDSLRDWINFTNFHAVVGGKVWILSMNDSYQSGKTRVTSEVDVPTNQTSNYFDASLGLQFGKEGLGFGYQNSQLNIQQNNIQDIIISDRLANIHQTLYGRFNRSLTEKTSFVFEGFHEWRNFTSDVIPRDDKGTGFKGGLSFSNIGRVGGQAIIGYKHYEAAVQEGVLQNFDGLIGSVNSQFRVTERVQIGALYSRDTIPSILEDNRFYIEDRYGTDCTVFVTRPLSIRGALIFGRNNYPMPVIVRNDEGDLVEEFVTDTIRSYAVNANYAILPHWSFTFLATYQTRVSGVQAFTKNRLYIVAGISTRY